jgi:hypothetical protein
MEFMEGSVGTPSALKSVHKEDASLSPKERLSYFDDDEAAVLPQRLGNDPMFQERAARVARSPEPERRAVAEHEATAYRRYRGPSRDWLIELLLSASEKPWRRFLAAEFDEKTEAAARQTWFANVPRRAVWVEAEPDENDPRRRRKRDQTLKEGANRIALGGAGQCVTCGAELADQYVRIGGSRRRTRRDRCEGCEKKPDLFAEAVRETYEAATRQRQQRRARRRG